MKDDFDTVLRTIKSRKVAGLNELFPKGKEI